MEGAALTLPGPDFPAPAKLNLFLHVVGRRLDGYHLLQTAFVFLDFGDTLRFRTRTDGLIRRVNHVEGVAEQDDLVVRAARKLKSATGSSLGADIEVAKRIPMGGGLGGGSSDAATTLLALNHLWETGLSRLELQTLGLSVGADVPVFVFGRSAWAEGVGEELQPVDHEDFYALVLTPPAHLPTQEVFASPDLTRNTNPLKMADFSAGGFLDFCARQRNDLQPVVLQRSSEVADYLAALEQASEDSLFALEGASKTGKARMTGSGACVFALFRTENAARQAQRRLPQGLSGGMQGFIARGLNRHPLFDLAR
jgi:4-diphosphocytidyl-2-C-methyl-D-erythritol kinase